MKEGLVLLPRSEKVWATNQELRKAARKHYLVLHRVVIELFLFIHYHHSDNDRGVNMVHSRFWKYFREQEVEDIIDLDTVIETGQSLFTALMKSYNDHEIPRKYPDVNVRTCAYERNGLRLNYFDYDGYDIPF